MGTDKKVFCYHPCVSKISLVLNFVSRMKTDYISSFSTSYKGLGQTKISRSGADIPAESCSVSSLFPFIYTINCVQWTLWSSH
jgi:hypothetical protein